MIKNKILYSSLTFIFFILPTLSIIPRMHRNNIVGFEKYYPNNKNYGKVYDFSSKKTIGYQTTGKQNDVYDIFNELAWSFLPAELIFSPLYYTYQISNKYLSSDLSINLHFMPNVNNVVYDENNDIVNLSNYTMLMRPLDENIFELSESSIKEKITSRFERIYDNICENYGQDQISKILSWNESLDSINYNLFDFVLNQMFFDEDTTLFYVYRTIYLHNSLSNNENNPYEHFAKIYISILDNLKSVPEVLQNFIHSTILNHNNINTILDCDAIKGKIANIYPLVGNNLNGPSNIKNVANLIKAINNLNVSNYSEGKWALSLFGTSKLSGFIISSKLPTIDIEIKKFIEFYKKNDYKNATDIFGGGIEDVSDPSFFTRFTQNRTINDYCNENTININSIESWNDKNLYTCFLYLLSGNDTEIVINDQKQIISSAEFNGSYDKFNNFVNVLKEYVNTDNTIQKELSKIISNNKDNYQNINFCLNNLYIDPNNVDHSAYIIDSYGNFYQKPYNNLIISSLVSGSIVFSLYIWIIYFAIKKSNSKND